MRSIWAGMVLALVIAGSASAAPEGQVTEFSAGLSSGSSPLGIAPGSDGSLWFTEFSASKIGALVIGGTPPPQIDAEFPLPGSRLAYGITAGPDGALWFTDFLGRVGRITTGGVVTEYTVAGNLEGIVAGPDGNLWFTDIAGAQVVHLPIGAPNECGSRADTP